MTAIFKDGKDEDDKKKEEKEDKKMTKNAVLKKSKDEELPTVVANSKPDLMAKIKTETENKPTVTAKPSIDPVAVVAATPPAVVNTAVESMKNAGAANEVATAMKALT